MTRRPKNQDLPGTEAEKIPELSKALEEYEDKKVERQEALKTEVKLKDKVIDLMGDHGLLKYSDGDLSVEVIDKSKKTIKVKHIGGDPEAD
jgi:hypothetical protein